MKSNIKLDKVTKLTLSFISAITLGGVFNVASAEEVVDTPVVEQPAPIEEAIPAPVVREEVVEYTAELPVEDEVQVVDVVEETEEVVEETEEVKESEEPKEETSEETTEEVKAEAKEEVKEEAKVEEVKEEVKPIEEELKESLEVEGLELKDDLQWVELEGIDYSAKGLQKTTIMVDGVEREVEIEILDEVDVTGVHTTSPAYSNIRIYYNDPVVGRWYDNAYSVHTINGRTAFCVEPLVSWYNNTTYTGEALTPGITLNNTWLGTETGTGYVDGTNVTFTEDKILKLEQIAQFGYENNPAGKSMQTYMFTQMYIWETLNGTTPNYTLGYMYGKQASYESFKAEIDKKLITTNKAEFPTTVLEFKQGETKTVTDSTGVLQYLTVPTTFNGYKIVKSADGKTLTITAPNNEVIENTLVLRGTLGDTESLLWRRTNQQAYATFGLNSKLSGMLKFLTTVEDATVAPTLGTIATGFNDAKVIDPFGENTLKDTMKYTGLEVGKEYTVKTTLVETGDATKVIKTFESKFTPTTVDGTHTVTTTVSGKDLIGKSVTWLEEIRDENNLLVTKHVDPNDTNQTIKFTQPDIYTKATGADGEKILTSVVDTKILEVAKVSGLVVGNTYKIKVMGYTLPDGTLVEGTSKEEEFVADATEKTFNYEFVVDGSKLAGKQVTFVEELLAKNEKGEFEIIAEHNKDKQNKDQTVTFQGIPKIKTLATGQDGTHEISPLATNTIKEVAELTGLTVGQKYRVTVQGYTLSDKKVLEGTNKVEEFVADAENKTFTFEFKVDGRKLAGNGVTFVEELFTIVGETPHLTTTHNKDLTVEEQTVHFVKPAITTLATSADGAKELSPLAVNTIKEVSKISGLKVGQKYRVNVQGYIVEDGSKIEGTSAVHEFVADATEKEFTFNFQVDGRLLQGKNVSFSEILYTQNEGGEFEETEKHNEDLTVEDQTVKFNKPDISTLATSEDGRKTLNPLSNQKVIEIAEITGLTVGQTYKVQVQGYIVEDGSKLEGTFAEHEFVADSDSKKFQFNFTVDGSKLAGKNLSFAEILFTKNEDDEFEETKKHNEDLTVKEQTVKFNEMPEIKTLATGHILDKHIYALPNQKVIEIAELTDLTIGEDYKVVVQGYLIDEEGNVTKFEGTSAVHEFTADKEAKAFQFEFTVNGEELIGKRLSFVEYLLTKNGKEEFQEVTNHNTDLSMEEQTVTFRGTPQIETLATNQDGGKEIFAAPNQKVIEIAKITGLTIGNEYKLIVQGYLVDEDGKGTEFEGTDHEETFVADAEEVEFKFEFIVDGTNLVGKKLSFAEELYEKNKDGEFEKVSEHNKDLTDENQTVKFVSVPVEDMEIPGRPTIVSTNDGSFISAIAGLGTTLLGALGLIKKREED